MNATYCTIVRPNLVLQFCVYQYDISTTKDNEFFLGIFGISKCNFLLRPRLGGLLERLHERLQVKPSQTFVL